MPSKKHFLIVDDDKDMIELLKVILEKAGHQVTAMTSSLQALNEIKSINPDCVISDLVMPELDGLDLFEHIKKIKNFKTPKFIVITVKHYDFDRRRAIRAGVDGYIYKPINHTTFVKDVTSIIENEMVIQFWGVRGSLPVPGEDTVRYGGNTNCVTLEIANRHFFIFDAGTGIKALSKDLEKNKVSPVSAKIFITHPHYDHIQGLPFFPPLYSKGNDFEVFGPTIDDVTIEKALADQMDSIYFPVSMREFAAKITFQNLAEETFKIEDVEINTIFLNHPGKCLGYKIKYNNKIFCYITDNEIPLEDSSNYSEFDFKRLVQFIQNADLLIMDAAYTKEEYVNKTFWGHSSVNRVVDIADIAKVKLLCLYHHDLSQTDKDIDKKIKTAQALLKQKKSITKCIAPKEGDIIVI